MTWINITLLVPLAMSASLRQPENYAAVIPPGGGLVVVRQKKTQAMLDIVTTKERWPELEALCKADAACTMIGGWDMSGKLSGAEWDAKDAEGKPTEVSKITKCDIPYNRDVYVTVAGTGADVHRFLGQEERERVLVGEKPATREVGMQMVVEVRQ